MTGSVLFYVQYLLGIGHLQRAQRIADALAGEGLDVTLVSGGAPVDLGVPARSLIVRGGALGASRSWKIVQLPPIRARDASFALVDGAGRPVDDELWQARRRTLLAAFAAARPDVVALEGFPFSRRAFRVELDPLIAAARGAARLVSSIRDILVVRDDPLRQREIVARVRADFDRVLVHGDPAFVPLEASFRAAPEIADRLVYTGYIAAAEDESAEGGDAGGDPEGVVVSAGGGAAGRALLQAALAARRAGCLAALRWRVLAGPHLPEAAFRALRDELPRNVVVERFRRDIARLLRRARVSVSQAGYNTVLDVLAARVPAVLVPFAEGRETEQTLRAEALAKRGVAEIVHAAELSPERLAAAIERASARG
ncbi:MAG TPA: glycosyltransferase, partial [Stellaceae bacterium]|nr:glycosyltransferase [Stellaceae bacterium]